MAFKSPGQRGAMFENLHQEALNPVKERTNASTAPIAPIKTQNTPTFTFKKIKQYMLRKPKAPRYF